MLYFIFAATSICDRTPSPCMNGGTCFLSSDKCDQYVCQCPDCFSGSQCQIRKYHMTLSL